MVDGTLETFIGIQAIGDGDFTLDSPSSGYWGIRVYDRLADARGVTEANPDGSNEAFPSTHYWVSAGDLVWEKRRFADGSETTSGEVDAAGFAFAFRSLENPDGYPDLGQPWAWVWRGNWTEP